MELITYVGMFYIHFEGPLVLYILWQFGILCGPFPRFGTWYQEKSGNPDVDLGFNTYLTWPL
jgi:hypothetical protein